MDRIAVIGAGPAGLLAAMLFARAGRDATLFVPRSERGRHRGHVHRITEPVLAVIETIAGGALRGWKAGPASVMHGGHIERLDDQPVVDAAGLTAALRRRAEASAVRIIEGPPRLRIEREGSGWRIGDARQAYSALIDASGAGRSIAGQIAGDNRLDWAVDEIGDRNQYRSWSGTGGEVDRPAGWTMAGQIDGVTTELFLIRHPGGQMQLTLRRPVGMPVPALPDALRALRVAGGGGIDAVLDRARMGVEAQAFNACAATILSIDTGELDHIPPYLPVGDCLVQTHPRFGRGFAQIAGQMTALSIHVSSGLTDWPTLQAGLLEGARAAWAAAAIRDRMVLAA